MTVKDPQSDDMTANRGTSQPIETNELSIKLWQAYRKFANMNIERIADALYVNGPLSFAELASKTQQARNILNHNLIEMRHNNLVMLNNDKYHLTKYGALLYESSKLIKEKLKNLNRTDLLTAFYENEA